MHNVRLPRRLFPLNAYSTFSATKRGAIVGGQTSCKEPEIKAFERQLKWVDDISIISVHSMHGPNVDPRGQPLVFIHGAGGSHLSWWQQVPAFADRYQVIIYDQRGFGDSRPRNGYDPSDAGALTDDLLHLLDNLGIPEPVVVVGHSLGSFPALDFAQSHPAYGLLRHVGSTEQQNAFTSEGASCSHYR